MKRELENYLVADIFVHNSNEGNEWACHYDEVNVGVRLNVEGNEVQSQKGERTYLEKDVQGVYAVWSGLDLNTVYIGSGKLRERSISHKSKLKRGAHGNKGLQKAFDESGEYRFEVLAVCENDEEAREVEQAYIKLFVIIDDITVTNKNRTACNKKYEYKLDEDDVRRIRVLINDGLSNKEIADLYNVNNSLISRIKHNKAWAWVE